MYFIKSFAICLLVVVWMVKDCYSFCEPFNKTLGLDKMCGYSGTAHFTHEKHFDSALRSMRSVSRLLSKCSPYAKLIVCSVYTPRCDATIPGPYLPCRRVCDEFNRQCSGQIFKYGMEWIIGMCQLLPEKDDPNTKLGYLGRCFEPPNFKTNVTKKIPMKCNKLIVPICQHIGFTHTVLPEERQKAYIPWASRKINEVSDKVQCSLSQRRFFCMENFPPCIDNNIGFYCRSKCEDFFKTNCTRPLNYKVDICMELPKGSGKNDVCKQTHWPRALNWPQVRDTFNGLLTTPRADIITTSAPETTQQPTHTIKPVPANNASAVKVRKTKTKSKAKVAPIVGGILAGICVIAIGLLIAYLIHKNRKNRDTFPYDKQILYNEEKVQM